MELLDKVIDIYLRSPRIAILMSGKGSNADVILKNQHMYPDLNFVAICTDNANSNAYDLSEAYHLDYYCLESCVKSSDDRESYFKTLSTYLSNQRIDTLIYAGFMKISTTTFLHQFPSINVHPADLTIIDDKTAKPKYTGLHAIRATIDSREKYIASTAHVVDSEVDCGAPIMVSPPLELSQLLTLKVSDIHETLKKTCEHLLFPEVLKSLAHGLISSQCTPYYLNNE